MTTASKPRRGKFIVLEGIDGCGKTTEIRRLNDYLSSQGLEVQNLDYPDRQGPIGKLINSYLYRKYDFSKEVQFLLYFADFVKDKEKIRAWLNEGKVVLSDRYFSSTLAYQCSDGFSLDNAVKMSEFFELAKPDLIIYLSISSKTSLARKSKEKGENLDRHEEDVKFLNRLHDMYENLSKNDVFSKWAKANGEQREDEVFLEIKKQLQGLGL